MKSRLLAAFAVLAALAAPQARAQEAAAPPAVEAATISPQLQADVDGLVKAALSSDLGYQIAESLTTEVGPRMAGSESEQRAREWGVKTFKRFGFQNVRVEPFMIPYWSRRYERAEIVAPTRQKMVMVALGGSGSTPIGGLEGEIVRFDSIAALNAAPDKAVAGKIVFIDEKMARTTDGSGYGPAVAKRRACGPASKAKGAVACIIRSVGTDSHRIAHQGFGGGDGTFPTGAVSAPDADQLTRLAQRGPVRIQLEIAADILPRVESGNVVAEVVGREKPDEIVLVGGHIDSWDQGTGAIDDASGVAIATAAAKLIQSLPKHPRRTIRVVMFGAEETGVHGGRAYAEAHKAEADKHVVAGESDFGAGRIWRFRTKFGPGGVPYAKAMQRFLSPLTIIPGGNEAEGEADVGGMGALGVPVIDLDQDGSQYFDIHHTPDDTLDKIDPEAMKQNVAAWASFLYLAAETDWDFRK